MKDNIPLFKIKSLLFPVEGTICTLPPFGTWSMVNVEVEKAQTPSGNETWEHSGGHTQDTNMCKAKKYRRRTLKHIYYLIGKNFKHGKA